MIGCGIRYSEISGGDAVDEIDDAIRHAGVDEGADQLGRRGRRFLRRLDDHRAARGQRRAQLLDHLVDREIPRREGGDRADRLLDRHLVDAGRARRDQPAVGAAAFLGEPFDDVGRRHRFHLGFGQDLALLLRHDRRDLVGALADQLGGLAHHLGPIVGRYVAPGPETLFGGFQRRVEIRTVRVRNRADRLFGRRIDDVQGAAARGGAPLAVDIQLHIRVFRCCFSA